jgi:hypothetical protein
MSDCLKKVVIPANNYSQYDKFAGFKVFKANNTIAINDKDESINIHINDYGRTLNAINYAAIKYLTEKYDFIRSTFIDFHGNWATQLTDDLPVYSICIGNGGYRLNNCSKWNFEPMPLIVAVREFFELFNRECIPEFMEATDIKVDSFTINFKVHVIAGKTYYYIDNLFMTDNNAKYTYRGVYNKSEPLRYCELEKGPAVSHHLSNNKEALSKYRDLMYDNVYTILRLIPGVLEKDNSVNKELVDRTLYKNTRLEQYLIDANTASGYKLF